ncbi:MAG TPA: archaemetzincin [Planctomycetaceae bacterium]|nr:archaemetzincin [Planctomycetaceae bacterium]
MSIARRGVAWILFLTIAGGSAAFARSALLQWGRDPEQEALNASVDLNSPSIVRMLRLRDAVVPLHRIKELPEPDDWLAHHPESGQTFPAYLASQFEVPSASRSRLYIVPIGDMTPTQQRIVQRTGDYLAACFGTTVTFLDSVSAAEIPPSARRLRTEDSPEEQWLATHILYEVLQPRRPDDAVAVLGLTATDLWPGPGWNYVFGQASLTARVGVWSLARNGDPDLGDDSYHLCLRRTIKTALHETGHMLGIVHCTAYECGMNGSKSRAESDRQPLEFCPECQAKVWWACGVDAAGRCQKLGDLAEGDGLSEASDLWHSEAKRLQAVGVSTSRN